MSPISITPCSTAPRKRDTRSARKLGKHSRPALLLAGKLTGLKHLPNLGFTLPARPIFFMKLHEANRRVHCFLLRRQFELREAANDFFSLRKGTIGHGNFSTGQPHACALNSWTKSAISKHLSGLRLFCRALHNFLHERLRRGPLVLRVFDDHHVSHWCESPLLVC